MAFATYVKIKTNGPYERRGPWFPSSELDDCNRQTWRWRDAGYDAATVMGKDEEGEL